MLARTDCPPEAIVLGKLGPVLFNFGVKSVLLALAVLWYGARVPATVFLAPIGLLGLVALGTGVGILLAPINIIYRDVSRILMALTTFWFFLSPVYFPAPSGGGIGTIMRINPVTPLLSATRDLALTGVVAHPVQLVLVSVATLLLLGIAWVYLRVALPIAIEQANN